MTVPMLWRRLLCAQWFGGVRSVSGVEKEITTLAATGKSFRGSSLQRENTFSCRGITIAYDSTILPIVPRVVAPERSLHAALKYVRPGADVCTDMLLGAYAQKLFASKNLIVGVVGSLKTNRQYDAQKRVIDDVLYSPQIGTVVDAGVSIGVSGLAGAIARSKRRHTVGCVAADQLPECGMRDTLIVHRDERLADIRRLLPDVVVALPGDESIRNDIQRTLNLGGIAVIAAGQGLLPTPVGVMCDRTAEGEGRLLTMANPREAVYEAVLENGGNAPLVRRRAERYDCLRTLLKSLPRG